MAIEALQHVKRMRGGAQGHLMRCSDGHYYVVKFRNNPQHLRVLANEFLATRLAGAGGIAGAGDGSGRGDGLAGVAFRGTEHTAGVPDDSVPGGIAVWSRYVVSPPYEGQVFDYLPAEMLDRVRNVETFAGILAMDKWTCNANGRQAAFWRKGREKDIPRPSSTRDIALMRGSGHFRIIRCAGVLAE